MQYIHYIHNIHYILCTHYIHEIHYIHQICPHRRCWGVIFRMALVKGYRFTWGGDIFRPKLIGRYARLQKTLSKTVRRHLFVNAPVQNRQAESEKNPCFFQLFDLNFLVCNIFFCSSAGGLARRRIFEFLDPFSD